MEGDKKLLSVIYGKRVKAGFYKGRKKKGKKFCPKDFMI